MATSNSTMTEIMELEQTELVIPQQYLCCRICDEEFKQPRFLPCLHTFCDCCITEHIDKNVDEDNYFPCPICATEIKNENDAAPLQENILARRLSKVSSSTNLKPQTLCWYCKNAGNFIDAVAVCEECDYSALCATCTESHKTTDETQNHKLISIDEYEVRVEEKKEEGLSQNDHVIHQCCELYDAMDIGAMFCVDCDLLICADCHVNNHGDHRCAELTAVAGHFESKIKDPLDELSNDEKELNEALQHLDESEQVIQNQTKKLHEVVKKRTKFLTDLIEEYEKMLFHEINKRNTLKMDEITNRRYDIKMHLQSINGVKEFTENLLSYGSYEEKVFLRKKVGYRIRELCEETLATDDVETLTLRLTKPNVTVETICNMFGELTERGVDTKSEANQADSNANIYPLNIENGHGSDTAENNDPELIEIFNHAHDSQYNSGSDTEMFSASNSNNSEGFKNVKFNEDIEKAEYEAENFFELGDPKRETELPAVIQRECIKGIGINCKGDMIVGTTSSGSQMIYVLEKRGIVKGTVPVNNGWNIHSVSSDGKVAMTIPRGDNRFKVRVLENDGTGHVLSDSNIESFGLNFVTADKNGNIIVTSNRYAKLRSHHGKSAKSGGNIAFYSKDGLLTKRVTNEDFHEFNLYLLEKPQCVAVDNNHDLLVVTDPGSNTVIAFNLKGELIFEYGNSDTEGEIYQGPDLVSIDKFGNIIVTDKREGRIDILSSKGLLKKSLILDDIPRFVGTLPDKLLVIVMPEGTMKYYDYL